MAKLESVDEALEYIKALSLNISSLDRVQSNRVLPSTRNAVRALHFITLIVVGVMVFLEGFTSLSFSELLLQSQTDQTVLVRLCVGIGLGLLACILVVYGLTQLGAQKDGEKITNYIDRNLKYLKVSSYLSDLVLKYFIVVLLLMGGLGHQVGPLLILFTGDHLIQGKFFQIKAAHRNILGWLLIGLSAFAWLQGWTSCLIPLLIFFVLTMISLLELSRKLKVESI